MFLRFGILFVCVLSFVLSREAGAEVPENGDVVKKIGESLYRVGEIQFDAESREIRIPVTVNMREGGPLEYLLVHESGKVHEAIFTTTVAPINLQIVMKLLRYQTGSGDVFNPLLATENIGKDGGVEEGRGDAVAFYFESSEGGDGVAVHEFVIDRQSAEAMLPGDWIYTGSEVREGTFLAEAEGSIIAIYLDPIAMLNMTREGADDDDRWGARTSVIPEIGTKGTLLIRAGEMRTSVEN